MNVLLQNRFRVLYIRREKIIRRMKSASEEEAYTYYLWPINASIIEQIDRCEYLHNRWTEKRIKYIHSTPLVRAYRSGPGG